MANTIQLKRSSTASNVPTAGELAEGELAMNTNPADRKLYSKDSGGTVFEVGAQYSHPTHPGDDFSVDTGPLTGANVVSDIDINVTTDTLGHVTDCNGVVSTRAITLDDIDTNSVKKNATETITGTWTLDGTVTTSDYGTGGRVKDGTDVSRPIGFNVMPVYEIDANDTFDLAHNGMIWHKDAGGAVTFTCPNDATIPQGATYVVHNDDTEAITIADATGVTLYWVEAGTAPAAGDVTLSQGGIITVYKYSDTEWWAWGAKEASASNPTLASLTDTDITSPADASFLIYDSGTTDWRDFTLSGDVSCTDAGVVTVNNDSHTHNANNLTGTTLNSGVTASSLTSVGTLTALNVSAAITADGLDIDDNHHIYLGTGDDIDMYFNGTDFYIDMIDGADYRLRGGAADDNMIVAIQDGAVSLYHNGGLELRTQQHEATGVTSGAEVYAHDGVLKDVGFNTLDVETEDVSDTLEAKHCGGVYFKDGTTAITLTLEASGATDFPVGGVTTIINAGTSANITVTEGASTTLYQLDGSARTDTAGGCTVGPGGVATLWREATTIYYIWGSGITP